MKLLRIFLAVYAVLLWGSAVAGPEYEKLIGKWKMQSASVQLPDTCNSMTFQFLADGTYIGDDGSMVMTMKYDIVEDGGGLLLNFFPAISDNGHPNCQGLSPQYVRQHPLRKSVVRFIDNSKSMRFYFGLTEQSPYLVLMRQD